MKTVAEIIDMVQEYVHAERCLPCDQHGMLADIERAIKERDAVLLVALHFYGDGCDAAESTPCGYQGNLCCKTARDAISKAQP